MMVPVARRITLLLAWVSLALTSPAEEADWPVTGQAQPALATVDSLLLDFVKEHKVPGAAVAIAKDGKLVYARGFGYADREKKRPVRPQSLFRVASISKPITAAAICQLVERRQLRFDAKVVELLELDKHVPEGKVLDPGWQAITIDLLYRHRAGFDRSKSGDPMFKTLQIAQEGGKAPPAAPWDVVRYQLGRPLDFKPGERQAYSNFGYCLLGRAVEKASGQPYERFVRDAMLLPLGIKSMKIGQTLATADGEVTYYDSNGRKGTSVFDGQTKVPTPYGAWCLETMDAHGGWIASAPDLVRFGSALDYPDRFPCFQGESIRERFRPRYTHTGGFDGTSTVLQRAPRGVTWAALFNTQAAPGVTWLADKLIPLMEKTLDGVKEWPSEDQFGTLGYEAL